MRYPRTAALVFLVFAALWPACWYVTASLTSALFEWFRISAICLRDGYGVAPLGPYFSPNFEALGQRLALFVLMYPMMFLMSGALLLALIVWHRGYVAKSIAIACTLALSFALEITFIEDWPADAWGLISLGGSFLIGAISSVLATVVCLMLLKWIGFKPPSRGTPMTPPGGPSLPPPT